SIEGYRCAEIVVTHHARQHGVSKYGVKRFARGFFDMLTVHFLKNYKDRPLHLFGGLAAVALLVGASSAAAGLLQSFSGAGIGMELLSIALASLSGALVLGSIGLTNELAISGKGGELHSPIASETQISMPLETAAPRVSTPSLSPSFGARAAVLRVDDPEHREAYATHLEDAHYRALVADNWNDAFDLAREFDATIFTDRSRGHLERDPFLRKAIERSPRAKLVYCLGPIEELPTPRSDTPRNLIPFPVGNSAA
ncbi:hypothetical protein QEH56_24425, partial [Pelagicoccus enzymogenes]|nr:hypothetical protein [Pelagicoccus enzymogenes]